MKRNNKKSILILMLVCIFLLAGCKNVRFNTYKESGETVTDNTEGQKNETTDTDEKAETKDGITLDDKDTKEEDEEDAPTPTMIQPVENRELLIYTVNGDADIEPVTALIPEGEEITPQLIVDRVVDSMADQSLQIGVEDVTTKDDAVIISFYEGQPPLGNVGAGLEVAILDAIAQSLTDNLEDYSKVIYRMEGKAYVSGHIELEIDEVYFED